MRKGESYRTGRPARPKNGPYYAASMQHRIASLEEATAETIREAIKKTRREIIAEQSASKLRGTNEPINTPT